jgi:hypothetical protein
VEKQRSTEAEKLKSKHARKYRKAEKLGREMQSKKSRQKNITPEENNPPFSSVFFLQSPFAQKKSDFSRQGAGILLESASRPYCNYRH